MPSQSPSWLQRPDSFVLRQGSQDSHSKPFYILNMHSGGPALGTDGQPEVPEAQEAAVIVPRTQLELELQAKVSARVRPLCASFPS